MGWVAKAQLTQDTKVFYSTRVECELKNGSACVDVTGIPIDEVVLVNGELAIDAAVKAAKDAKLAALALEETKRKDRLLALKQSLSSIDPSKLNTVKELGDYAALLWEYILKK